MKTKEILSIVALAVIGLCLLCSLAKLVMKSGDKKKKHCNKACGAFVFLATVLLAVSQLLGETERYDSSDIECTVTSECPPGNACVPTGQNGEIKKVCQAFDATSRAPGKKKGAANTNIGHWTQPYRTEDCSWSQKGGSDAVHNGSFKKSVYPNSSTKSCPDSKISCHRNCGSNGPDMYGAYDECRSDCFDAECKSKNMKWNGEWFDEGNWYFRGQCEK